MHETNGHDANIGCISYMQGHLIAVVSGYTFEACVLGQNEFKVEVVVHGPSWEVVVHGDGSCTRFVDVRVDSSGTRFREELDAHGVDGRGP